MNDIVLAYVSGGIRDYFVGRGVAMEKHPDFLFRAFCPVGIHTSRRGSVGGNFVSAILAEVPVWEPNPLQRLAKIHAFTREHKDNGTVRGTEIFETIAGEVWLSLIRMFAQAVESSRAYNLVVTNVPGPQLPLYLLSAPMAESFPLVPLFGHQGVGTALLSYNGHLCWGFSADRDIVPDLHDLVESVRRSFEELCRLAALPDGPASEATEAPGDADQARVPMTGPPSPVRQVDAV